MITRGSDQPGVILSNLINAVRHGVIILHGVLGLALITADVIVAAHITGQIFYCGDITSAGGDGKVVGIVGDGFYHIRPCIAVRHGPALDRVAVYRVPAAVLLFLEDHSKHQRIILLSEIDRFLRCFSLYAVCRIIQVYCAVHRSGYLWHGVSAGLPQVIAQQQKITIICFIKAQFHISGTSVAVWYFCLHQNQISFLIRCIDLLRSIRSISGIDLLEGNQAAVLLLEHKAAGPIGGTCGNDSTIRQLKFKLRAGDLGVILVHLDERTLRDVDQIELQGHIGVRIAPLQIEKVQGVGGIVGKGLFVPLDKSFFSGIPEHLFQGSGFGARRTAAFTPVDLDFSGREVDGQTGGVVYTAQVSHQHTVNEHPYIVIPGELVGYRFCTLCFIHMASILLNKPGGHVQAKVVVDGRILGVTRIHKLIFLIFIGNCLGLIGRLVEGEKLANGRGSSGDDSRIFVQDKRIVVLIIYRVILGAVIVEISILIYLQQIFHIFIAGLTIVLYIRIKQIGQRLVSVRSL